MIDLSQKTIFELLIKAFLLGVVLGLFYDAIRLVKMLFGIDYFDKSAKKTRLGKAFEHIVTFISDVIFWLIFGISSVLLLYNVSGGVFRFSIYPVMLSGLFLYYISLGRIMLYLSSRIVLLLKKICRAAAKLMLIPLRSIKKILFSLYHLTIGKILGRIKEERKLRAEKKAAILQENEPTPTRESEEASEYDGQIYRREGRINFGIRR